MSLKLWQLADLAIPLVVMLLSQALFMAIFAYFIVFRAMGKDYEAAVMTSGVCGFGLGATPNAIANMTAMTELFGPAPTPSSSSPSSAAHPSTSQRIDHHRVHQHIPLGVRS